MLKRAMLLMILGGLLWSGAALAAQSVDPPVTRVKDIARLQGIRNNQLNGMGLVVGLNGTGDSSKANAELVVNALLRWGIDNISADDLKVKNIAAVFITATLPPFAHAGDTLSVQVSSLGDAKSLQGGVLLQSPLTGADGNVYAVAQGPVHLVGYMAGERGSRQQKNVTTVGMVPSGAIVEREVPMVMDNNGKLRWALANPDFTTASRLAKTINDNIFEGVARALDMGSVEVTIPAARAADPVAFVAEIETLPITPDGVAKVVINERTGTVVIGEKVRIAPVAVTHRNITVKVDSNRRVSQPPPLSEGDTTVVENQTVAVAEEPGRLILLPGGTNIGAIIQALNAVGTTPQDIIAVVVAIKESGALYGILEFI
jgi:flagellar P-ring protein precursor FlgI